MKREIAELLGDGDLIAASQVWQRDVGYGVGMYTLSKHGVQSTSLLDALNRVILE